MMNALHSLSVLITRPKHQAEQLIELIQRQQGDYYLLPCVEITTKKIDRQRLLTQLNKADYAIFLSANAVEAVYSLWPKQLSAEVIAIGDGSKKALVDHNIAVDYVPEHFSSEGILSLPEMRSAQNKSIVIFCGQNPKPLLKQSLAANNDVVEIICYQRQQPHYDLQQIMPILQAKKINCIVSTSLESLQNCAQIFAAEKQWLLSKPLVVISEKMAEHAKRMGFTAPIIVADNVSLASLEVALIELAKIAYNNGHH